ncbi:MAG: heme exporter protein CcmD, partial [Chromatocurvus sp.]
MYFDSIQALIEMDGHGVFVWSAYGISIIVLGVLAIAPYRRQRRLLAAIRAGQRRAASAGASNPTSMLSGVDSASESI